MNKDIFVKLLQQRQFKAVRSILDVMNEVDIASLLSELDDPIIGHATDIPLISFAFGYDSVFANFGFQSNGFIPSLA